MKHRGRRKRGSQELKKALNLLHTLRFSISMEYQVVHHAGIVFLHSRVSKTAYRLKQPLGQPFSQAAQRLTPRQYPAGRAAGSVLRPGCRGSGNRFPSWRIGTSCCGRGSCRRGLGSVSTGCKLHLVSLVQDQKGSASLSGRSLGANQECRLA